MSSEPTAELIIEKTTRGRTALNFWIDLVTCIAFCILIGTSTIMKFILPPGTCDGEGVKVWLTHSRHWWGDIHFWVAVLMLALMIVHVWLHWGWVTRIWGRLIGSGRAVQTWLVLVFMASFIAVPFIIPGQYLAVDVAPDRPVAEGGAVTAGTQVAPCGIEGLSCADCPAADDRLFGGGCASGDDEAEAAAGDDTAAETAGAEEGCGGEDCATCPFSTGCATEETAETEPVEETDA